MSAAPLSEDGLEDALVLEALCEGAWHRVYSLFDEDRERTDDPALACYCVARRARDGLWLAIELGAGHLRARAAGVARAQ
jgi:hypothetical protein